MNKAEFLRHLAQGLSQLPAAERQKSLEYYEEMIGDRMEEGMSEAEAVAALGDLAAIIEEIMYDQPLSALFKARMRVSRERRRGNWLLLLLILVSFPLWLPLLAALLLLMLGLYLGLWALLVGLFVGLLGLALVAVAGVVGGIVYCLVAAFPPGLCLFGVALACGGLTLLLLAPLLLAAKALLRLARALLRKLKSLFINGKGA